MSGLKTFKGAMSKFYDEQRAVVKGMKERSLVNKARNEAKREMEEAQSDQPLHLLRLDGHAAHLVRNDAAAYAVQHSPEQGLVQWAAQPGVLIDRYDARSLLDIYVEPDPRVWKQRQRSAQEAELEEQLQFEGFRDLIRLKCLGLSERQGMKHAEQENVAIRAQARQAAVAAIEQTQAPKPLPSQNAAFASMGGTGQYAAVGFAYGGDAGGTGYDEAGGREEEEAEEEESDDDLPVTAEDQDMDRLAVKDFKIEDFSSMLRWAMREEEAEAAAQRRRRRAGWSRKKAKLRSKRLEGQGLDPQLYTKPPPGQSARQPQGADISWIPEKKPEELAHKFAGDHPQQGAAQHAAAGQQGPTDALPGAYDPARPGPALLPAEAMKLHGVRPEDRQREKYGSISGRDYSKARVAATAAAAAATVVRAVDKSKETPQERLKRLMAAQLNKKIQKDSLASTQKLQQQEAEQRARAGHETTVADLQRQERRRERDPYRSGTAGGLAGYPRGRERSRSPGERYRRRDSRSRSRSRERERDRQQPEYRSSRRSPSPPPRHHSSGRR